MESLRYDLAFAVRALRRNWLFTISVVLTLAIGIGAATAVFGVINRCRSAISRASSCCEWSSSS